MDRVVVIDDGEIVQDGKHNSLVRKDGPYKELWKLQQDGFIVE
jgi:ATP-binding cassette subfamily B protein RtxB